ncbi:MAG: ornithine cyclodeaminase family protein [Ilumatobacteraceae bacterium]
MTTVPVWLTEADVVSLLDLQTAIRVVRGFLSEQERGTAHTLTKTALTWGDGHTLHALGGEADGVGVVGVKTWAHAAGRPCPLLVLWSSHSGELMAVIEAFALGQLRTASVSAVATAALARPDASTLALIGTGKQALAQIAAVVAVRPITRVNVFSPTVERRHDFVTRVQAMNMPFDVVECESVAQATLGADVITSVTRARQPILFATDLAPEVHVNALGSIALGRRELDAGVVAVMDVVVSDSPDIARNLSSELDEIEQVEPLSKYAAENWTRPETAARTLFKAMGLGLADVACGVETLNRAGALSMGRVIPPIERHDPIFLLR